MAIAVKCPECSYKGQVPDSFAGRKVKCPGCSIFFTVSAEAPVEKAKTAPAKANGEKAAPEKSAPEKGAAEKAAPQKGAEKAASTKAATEKSVPVKAGAKAGPRKAGNAFQFEEAGSDAKSPPAARFKKKRHDSRPKGPLVIGLVALVLALGGAGVCFVPKAVLAGLGLGIGGALFGLLGLAWDLVGKRLGLVSLLGLLLSGGAIGLAAGVQTGAIKLPGPGASTEVVEKPKTSEDKPAEKKNEPPPDPPGVTWVEATKPIRTGDARLKITGVQIGPVAGSNLDPAKAKQTFLQVQLKIENVGSKGITYHGGGDAELAKNDQHMPQAMDSQRNLLKLVTFAKGQVAGQVKSQAIENGKAVDDVLVFDSPSFLQDFVYLVLPGVNFGGSEVLRVKIPKDMIAVGPVTQTPATPMPAPMPPTGTETPKPTPPIQGVDAATVKELQQMLKDKDRNTRKEGCEKIGELGPKAVGLAADLVALLENQKEDDRVRVAAAESLGDLGPKAASASALVLANVLSEEDSFEELKKQAVIALGKMGPEPEVKFVVSQLEKYFKKTKDKLVQQAIRDAVKKIDPTKKLG